MQRASPVSGMMEWVCCDEDEDDIKHEIARCEFCSFKDYMQINNLLIFIINIYFI